MVFQDYALFPHLTVADNVGFGLPAPHAASARARAARASSVSTGSSAAIRTSSRAASSSASRSHARSRPAPELVLLDEPWSNVDPFLRESLRAEVAEIIRPLGVTVLLVTHDREEAFSLADRIALMRDGNGRAGGDRRGALLRARDTLGGGVRRCGERPLGPRRRGRVETAIGAFPANGASARSDAQVSCGRSSSSSSRAPPGPAEVVAREFRGHDVFYRVLLDGVELVSQRPSTEVVDLGSRVAIRVHDGRVPVSTDAATLVQLCKVYLTPRLR